jgi:nicotinamide-nucleotide amidase
VLSSRGAMRFCLGVAQVSLVGRVLDWAVCARLWGGGARRLFGADLALALTGAAGPQPHAGAEPGQIWAALEAEGVSHQRGLRSPGDRDLVRRWAEQVGLDLVRRHLQGAPLPDGPRPA